ncbi:flavodoxin domain-containing protein [Rhodococcoides yunnanense]|uniref:flavodoxin domain-containing protein n=1 Tax=Rhodococcoides yunnanense TaxID=278209 RepID=UPI000933DDDD|nr:flavodoxin domain-containing protein [Rhodococcus yunnanensis]
MRILVAYASRHGATQELAERIGGALVDDMLERGVAFEVDVIEASSVDSVAEYDAVILGSAVYLNRWLRSARRLIAREHCALHTMPVWLFSSGPVDIAQATPQTKPSWAVDHHMFGGKLDLSVLSRTERLMARLVRATSGDGRSDTDIQQWVAGIGDDLVPHSSRTAGRHHRIPSHAGR